MNVIVYGPQGSGKSMNAKAMLKHFNLKHFHDGETFPQNVDFTLIIRQEKPTDEQAQNARVYSIDEVKKLMGTKFSQHKVL